MRSRLPTSGSSGQSHRRRPAANRLLAALALAAIAVGAGCSGTPDRPPQRSVAVAFYGYFEPVSYSANPDMSSEGFNDHRGYEADLLSGVESMDGIGLDFERKGVAHWDDIWLLAASDEVHLVCGGITILEARTSDADGRPMVAFTDGHIDFRQSLLVRSDDAERLAAYDGLGAGDVVGVLRGTTGEARLLQIIDVADDYGGLAAGTTVETDTGRVKAHADGELRIDAAGASSELASRRRLIPAAPGSPQVLYLGDTDGAPLGEAALLDALRTGHVDAVARGSVGNAEAATASGGDFAVAATDTLRERGGCTVDIDDTDLLDRMNTAVGWLTDNGRIGFTDWLADPNVFSARAAQWDRSG